MPALEIYAETYQALAYDLQAAIDEYTAALPDHSATVGQAAPAAPSIVEAIVKNHGGLWVIVPAPEPPPKQPLPQDPKYYRSRSEQTKLLADEAKDTGPEVDPA